MVSKNVQTKFLKFLIPSIRPATGELFNNFIENIIEHLETPPMRVPIFGNDELPQDEHFSEQYKKLHNDVSEAKSKLNKFTPREYESLAMTVDLYHTLKGRLRGEFNMQIATNAAMKIYEIVSQMDLFPSTGVIRVFSNAELPGAFIVAINHFIKTNLTDVDFDWLASSYYPDETTEGFTIFGDNYGLYKNNREHWFMGPKPNAFIDDTVVNGNLLDADVVKTIALGVHQKFDALVADKSSTGATLYTSDAGTDVSEDFNRQEELTSMLNYGQVICGLFSLAKGGNFVTKQYTFLTLFNRSLICLVSILFDETYIIKPLTSRPINSEIYIVGKGFKGISIELQEALLQRLSFYSKQKNGTTPCDWSPLLDYSIFYNIDKKILQVAQKIFTQQIVFINEAVTFHQTFRGDMELLKKRLWKLYREVHAEWLSQNKMKRITKDKWISSTK